MKKKVRVKPSVPFYSSEPAVSKKLMADSTMSQSASLGNTPPKMVPKNPGRLSGIAGFSSKHKPSAPGVNANIPKLGTKASSPASNKLRMSGHQGAHRLGAPKLK